MQYRNVKGFFDEGEREKRFLRHLARPRDSSRRARLPVPRGSQACAILPITCWTEWRKFHGASVAQCHATI